MNTFKKLFSVTAIVALIGTLVPMFAFGATYSNELTDAYDYAYNNGITTMSSIDNADMYGSLTRVAMAKMMANYSMDVLGLTVDTSLDCNFPDVSSDLNAQYDNGVTNACQLGLMGVGIDNFNPYGLVTRAEFGTVLSRALYGDAYNGADPYYADHLDALQDADVMSNISNPMMLEVRGYVMLMMQRADEDSAMDGCSAEELLACITADDYDDCIATCSDDETVECDAGEVYNEDTDSCEIEYTQEVSGELEVDLASTQPATQVPAGVVAVEIATLDFDAAAGDDVILDSIELEATGYGDYRALDNVAIYDDRGVKVSRERDVDTDGEAELNFINGYVLKAGSREKLTITATITKDRDADGTDDVQNGDTFGFDVVAISGPEDVDGLPLSTQIVSVVTINNMGVFEAEVDQTASSVKIGEESVLIGGFKLKNENKEEDLYVKSIVFEQIGTIDEDYIEDVVIFADGQKVSDSDVLWDRDEVTIAFDNDGYLLSEDTSSFVEFDIRATITGEPTKSVGFEIAEDSDIVIIGARHGFRVAEVGTEVFPMTLSDVAAVVVEGADILATFDKTDADSVVADKDEFVFGALELESMSTNYILNDYAIELTVVSTVVYADLITAGITDIELGGDSYDSVVVTDDGATETYFTLNFKDIDIDGGAMTQLPLAVDFDNATADDKFKFDLSLEGVDGGTPSSFELEDLDNDETYIYVADVNDIFSTTTFSSRTVTVEAGSLTVDSTKVTGQEVVISNDTTFISGLGKFIATDAEDIMVKKLKMTATTNIDDANSIALTLEDIASDITITIDGSDYDGDIVADVVTFEDDFAVDAGEVSDYEIRFDMKDKDLLNNIGTISFQMTEVIYRAGDADDVTDVLALDLVNGDFTVIENGDLTITVDTTEDDMNTYTEFTDVDKYVLAGGSDITLAKLKLNANKEDMKIKDIYFDLITAAGTLASLTELKDSITDIYLVADGETHVGVLEMDTVNTELVAKFESVNTIVGEDALEYAYLKADFSAIDENATTTAVAGANVEVELLGHTVADDLYATDVVGVESDEDDVTLVLTLDTVVSNVTTLAANVPTAVTLTSANTSILSAGTFPVAYLEVTMDEQTVNVDADSKILDAILTNLNVDFSFSAGVVTTYTIEKVGGVEAAVALTDEGNNDTTGLLADADITAGTTFVIKAVVTNAGTREDGAIIQVRLADITADVTLDDGTGSPTLMTVPAGTNKDISVNNEG